MVLTVAKCTVFNFDGFGQNKLKEFADVQNPRNFFPFL